MVTGLGGPAGASCGGAGGCSGDVVPGFGCFSTTVTVGCVCGAAAVGWASLGTGVSQVAVSAAVVATVPGGVGAAAGIGVSGGDIDATEAMLVFSCEMCWC